MDIRFRANYQILGPARPNVQAEADLLQAQSQKLAFSVVASTGTEKSPAANPNEQFGGFVVTDKDAAKFLKQQGLPDIDLNRDKALVQQEGDAFIRQKFALATPEGLSQFVLALCRFSYFESLVKNNVIEKRLFS